MRIRFGISWGLGPLFVMLAVGCSSSSSPVSDDDASTPVDSGADAASDASESGPMTVNGCAATDFAAGNHTAASDPRAITFAPTPTPEQFSPACMMIKVGQSVTWTGDFVDHPLEATPGGPAGSPIVDPTSGSTTTIAFSAAGTYPYDCANHPTIMLGAIEVVP